MATRSVEELLSFATLHQIRLHGDLARFLPVWEAKKAEFSDMRYKQAVRKSAQNEWDLNLEKLLALKKDLTAVTGAARASLMAEGQKLLNLSERAPTDKRIVESLKTFAQDSFCPQDAWLSDLIRDFQAKYAGHGGRAKREEPRNRKPDKKRRKDERPPQSHQTKSRRKRRSRRHGLVGIATKLGLIGGLAFLGNRYLVPLKEGLTADPASGPGPELENLDPNFVVPVVLGGQVGMSEAVAELYQRALQHLSTGRVQAALRILDDAAQELPYDHRVLTQRARALLTVAEDPNRLRERSIHLKRAEKDLAEVFNTHDGRRYVPAYVEHCLVSEALNRQADAAQSRNKGIALGLNDFDEYMALRRKELEAAR